MFPKPEDFGINQETRLQSMCEAIRASYMARAGRLSQKIYMDRLKAVQTTFESVTADSLIMAVTTRDHKVFITDQSWDLCSCSCPDFFYQRTASGGSCKHMAAVALKFLESGP